jgi:hypothetical protein
LKVGESIIKRLEAPEEQMKINRLYPAICVGVLLMTVSVPSRAQDAAGPRVENFRSKLKAKYLEKRERFLHRVKDLYFAAGCKVLANEAGILPLTSSESYLAYVGEQTIIDTKDEFARREAAREGQEQAARPGQCDYYRRHPEAAEAARRAVAEAKAKQ